MDSSVEEFYLPNALWRHIKRSYLDLGVNSKYYLNGVNKELMTEIKHFFLFRRMSTFSLAASAARRYRYLRHISLSEAEMLYLEWYCLQS